MIKCLLLLPTSYNDGQPVEPAKLENCFSRFGFSHRGPHGRRNV